MQSLSVHTKYLNMNWNNHTNIEAMLGVVFIDITNNVDTVVFTCNDGTTFTMVHDQDCCEHVRVDDVIGDLQDLIGSPILQAEEVTSREHPEDRDKADNDWDESFTWTFYKLATIKGYVTIRWFGESNGYYSESVSIYKEDGNENQIIGQSTII